MQAALVPSFGVLAAFVITATVAAQTPMQVEAGSGKNQVVITIANPSDDATVEELVLQVTRRPPWVRDVSIETDGLGVLGPGAERTFTIDFSIAHDAPPRATGELVLEVVAEAGVFPDQSEIRVRLSVAQNPRVGADLPGTKPESPDPAVSSAPPESPDAEGSGGRTQGGQQGEAPGGGSAPDDGDGGAPPSEPPTGSGSSEGTGADAAPGTAACAVIPDVVGMTVAEARHALGACPVTGLELSMLFSGDDEERVEEAIPSGAGVVLRVRPPRAEGIVVPGGLVGLPVREAFEIVERAELLPIVMVGSEVPSLQDLGAGEAGPAPPEIGTVERTSPPSGAEVEQSAEVELYVWSQGTGAGVTVPVIQGLTEETARAVLAGPDPDNPLLFLDKARDGEPASNPSEVGRIYRQYPDPREEPGLEVPRGTGVLAYFYSEPAEAGGGGEQFGDGGTGVGLAYLDLAVPGWEAFRVESIRVDVDGDLRDHRGSRLHRPPGGWEGRVHLEYKGILEIAQRRYGDLVWVRAGLEWDQPGKPRASPSGGFFRGRFCEEEGPRERNLETSFTLESGIPVTLNDLLLRRQSQRRRAAGWARTGLGVFRREEIVRPILEDLLEHLLAQIETIAAPCP